jgi:SAM-dependent MidA family methyltransferase
MSAYIPWIDAWESAAFGPRGFYGEFGVKGVDPYQHFRTAVQSDPDLAKKLFPYLLETYEYCGSPSKFLVLDVGGSNGSLIKFLKPFIAEAGLNWKTQIYDVSSGDVRHIPIREKFGVVIAHELLDDIPTSIVEYDEDLTPRSVLVDPETGHERLGIGIAEMELDWLNTWWPQTVPHARREIGITRDHTWAKLVNVFGVGRAIAIDYSHSMGQRTQGLFDAGTLTGYQRGRSVRTIPNGEVNITAHVALGSCASTAIKSRPDVTATHITEPDPGHSDFRWLIQDFGSKP